ncbi:Uncharacterised protein [Helicobacter canis]|uniref:Uncharacterized protein n=1 Tax=Helicobacter canis TaxID=29419 RepID=A0A377JL67_9HELI|nr:Uncharacterised protein [Helicobacter canis]
MICGLIGTIHKLEPMRVELNVQGVIYGIALVCRQVRSCE